MANHNSNMTIIAVRGVPRNWNLTSLVNLLAKGVKGHFEALNFGRNLDRGGTKTAYLRLSQFLNPRQVVENINCMKSAKYKTLVAFIPDHVPDLPLSKNPVQVKGNIKRKLGIPIITEPNQILTATHKEIMREIQYKYTGLFLLSQKKEHKLLTEIARSIFQRLKHIMNTNKEANQGCFHLSRIYRKVHPHFGDFQFILSTFHKLQDAEGVPRKELQESDLILPVRINKKTQSNDKFQLISSKIGNDIIKTMKDHIDKLEIEESPVTEEDIARKKIRIQLKKISPLMPLIVKQIITDYLEPTQLNKLERCRIYGEPFMPNINEMKGFLKKFHVKGIRRFDRMYNLLRFECPLHMLEKVLALDGTMLGSTKLIIRTSDKPAFLLPQSLIDEMKQEYGVEYKNDVLRDDEEEFMDVDGEVGEGDGDGEEYEGADGDMEADGDQDWQEPWD